MDSISFKQAQEQLLNLIQEANSGKQFLITSDAGNVVVMPEETYQNILVTLELLSTPGLLGRIKVDEEEEPFQETDFQRAS